MPIDKLIGNFMSSPTANGALGGAASGALVSLLMGTKSGRKLGKTAIKVGGAAAVAGVGYYAYKKWQDSRQGQSGAVTNPSAAPASRQVAPPTLAAASEQVEVSETLAAKLILAMIAATAADGAIDDKEMDTLLNSMEASSFSAADNARLTAALNRPPSLEEIVSLAGGPEEASELYAASFAAIDLDTPAENLYLRRLARSLSLDPELVQTIHLNAV